MPRNDLASDEQIADMRQTLEEMRPSRPRQEEATQPASNPQRTRPFVIRQKHRKAAMMLADGVRQVDVAREIGVIPRTIRVWNKAPEFQQLIEEYKSVDTFVMPASEMDLKECTENVQRLALLVAAKSLKRAYDSDNPQLQRLTAKDFLSPAALHRFTGFDGAEKQEKNLNIKISNRISNHESAEIVYPEDAPAEAV